MTEFPFSVSLHKAGMQEIDKSSIGTIISTMTSGSKFQQAIDIRKRRIQEQVLELRTYMEQHGHLLSSYGYQVDSFLQNSTTHTELVIESGAFFLHIDMDAFFASIEELHNPGLACVPMAVGSLSMLSTANYVARKYGISSAMPGYIAKRLCPELVIIPGRMEVYQAYGVEIRSILQKYDPKLRSFSWDEASLNVTSKCKVLSEPQRESFLNEIRQEIYTRTGLTSSAGLAYTRVLAKIASNYRKPNGQFVVPSSLAFIKDWLGPLSIRKIPGVGPVSEQVLLQTFGISTCAHLYEHRYWLALAFHNNPNHWKGLLSSALGLLPLEDSNSFEGTEARKSISVDRSFSSTCDPLRLKTIASEILKELLLDANSKQLVSFHTLTLRIKNENFALFSKSKTFKTPFSLSKGECFLLLEPEVLGLLSFFLDRFAVRLIGVKISNLIYHTATSIESFIERSTPFVVASWCCSNCGKENFTSYSSYFIHEQECRPSLKPPSSGNSLHSYWN